MLVLLLPARLDNNENLAAVACKKFWAIEKTTQALYDREYILSNWPPGKRKYTKRLPPLIRASDLISGKNIAVNKFRHAVCPGSCIFTCQFYKVERDHLHLPCSLLNWVSDVQHLNRVNNKQLCLFHLRGICSCFQLHDLFCSVLFSEARCFQQYACLILRIPSKFILSHPKFESSNPISSTYVSPVMKVLQFFRK